MALIKEFSIQLYMLHDYTEKDFPGTLDKLGLLGYRGVEFVGYGTLTAGEMKSLLEKNKLRPVGTHIGLDRFTNNWQEEKAYNKEIGTEYLILPRPRTELKTIEDLKSLIASIKEIAAKVKDAGFKFAYHNHGYEFVKQGEKYFLDVILEEVLEEDMALELDIAWLPYMKVDYKSWLQKHGKRIKLFHMKQVADKEAKQTVDMGPGFIDYPGVISDALKAGTKHFVLEQDEFAVSPWKSAERALAYTTR